MGNCCGANSNEPLNVDAPYKIERRNRQKPPSRSLMASQKSVYSTMDREEIIEAPTRKELNVYKKEFSLTISSHKDKEEL